MEPGAACAQLRPWVEGYGKEGDSGLPFSETGWLHGLVNLTEWMGATGFDYSNGESFPTEAEFKLAYAAGQLRDMTIMGGMDNPVFADGLADLGDACKKAFPGTGF
jgi:hypothetical protein